MANKLILFRSSKELKIVGLSKGLKSLDATGKKELFGAIRKAWVASIKDQFSSRGLGRWRALTADYAKSKGSDKILERNTRNKLSTRWSNAIKVDNRTDSIKLFYPPTPRTTYKKNKNPSQDEAYTGQVARAHQLGIADRRHKAQREESERTGKPPKTSSNSANKLVRRPLLIRLFKETARTAIENYFRR